MRRNILGLRDRASDNFDRALEEVTILDAIDLAQATWPNLGILPAGALPAAIEALAAIGDAADHHDAITMSELAGDTAASVLTQVTGVENPTSGHPRPQMDTLHYHRNLITALRGTLALNLDGHDLAVGDLAHGLPALHQRTRR